MASKETVKTCPVCGHILNSTHAYRHHMKTKHGALNVRARRSSAPKAANVPIKCSLCADVVASNDVLTNHMVVKHGRKLCTECNHTYRDDKILKQHIKLVHSALKCFWCDEVFNTEAARTAHIDAQHPDAIVACMFPGCTFTNKAPVEVHKHTWTVHQQYGCTECKTICATSDSFIAHNKAQHKLTVFMCPECKEIFYTANAMRAHEDHVHYIQHCPLCDMAVPIHLLGAHTHTVHSRRIENVVLLPASYCNLCNVAFNPNDESQRLYHEHISVDPNFVSSLSDNLQAGHNLLDIGDTLPEFTGGFPPISLRNNPELTALVALSELGNIPEPASTTASINNTVALEDNPEFLAMIEEFLNPK